jgi:ABC-type sugar transport system substrate-binding protein
MNDEVLETIEAAHVTRRGLLVKGGIAAAGLTALSAPASKAVAAADAGIKVAVVTHGDTGSFWSVFKKGVDQAAKDLRNRGVSVTQVYANNDVAKQVAVRREDRVRIVKVEASTER